MSDTTPDNPLESLDVFWTELSPTRAVVYARLTDVPYQNGWRLTGTIRGPRSVRHETLPATVPFSDLGPGPTHLARAVVPDPSYWSPDSPNLYDVTIELHRDGQPPLVEKRLLGFKPIRAGARYLLREGKTWIPRGVQVPHGEFQPIAEARERCLMLVLAEAYEPTLLRASEQGVYLAMEFDGSSPDVVTHLQRFSRFPASTLAIIHGTPGEVQQLRQAAPNLLLAQCVAVDGVEVWGDVVWLPANGMERDSVWLHELDRPVLWSFPIESRGDLVEARRYCDKLQTLVVLEGYGQFAGYFV